MRLAFARINQETNALSPVATELADFKRTHFLEGAALLRACAKGAFEVEGMFKNAELSDFVQHAAAQPDVERVPLLSAWAVPSGPLTLAGLDAPGDRTAAPLRKAPARDPTPLRTKGQLVRRRPGGHLPLLLALRGVAAFLRVLDSVPGNRRVVFLLYELEGMPPTEIAAVVAFLDKTPKAGFGN